MPVIIEYKKLAENPEFQRVLTDTREEAMKRAADSWGISFGGMYPGPGEFGETTIRIPFMNLGTSHGTAETWRRDFASKGWNTMVDQETIEDVYLGICGFTLPSPVCNISAIKMEVGDTKLPVINIEGDIDSFEQPVVLFERGVVVPEETPIKIECLVNATGPNIVKPLGFALAKQKILIAKKPV